MKRMMIATALAAFAFVGPALADDIEALKGPALETCKKEMGGGEANPELDKVCGCMIDNIVTVYGDDADEMLKIIGANLNPSDTAEIAKLLGITEDEAKAFVKVADEKMDEVQKVCMPQ